jgi:hypothetical protein
VGAISQELVRFDTQIMQTPDISGVEEEQGTLAGYEVREYLLEKWGRRCAYCKKKDVPLQIEHLTPRARGGSNRLSNLTLACEACNVKKGTQTAEEFGLPELQAQASIPLKDAATVNATRWALWRRLEDIGLPLETGTGGRTKWNRTQRGLPKAHWIDAACVGASTPELLRVDGVTVLTITARGHGNRQMAQIDGYGFPRLTKAGKQQVRSRQKRHFGFMTGDMVRAVVPPGTKASGQHTGRIAVRAGGGVRVGQVDDIRWKHGRLLQRHDGYGYACAGARQTGPRQG